MALTKAERRLRIRRRIRKVVTGTAQKPRLSVFRSNKEIYAQLIDDINQTTLLSYSSRSKEMEGTTGTKSDKSYQVGQGLAKLAAEKGITEVCFDRGGYLYHGRVKQLAEGAREGGLKF
ncbi:MAG: 50S ribosomal protein L18 [Flavobacteriales bacterium]|nr:50S ribosomal protein L18 [Cryomorphaceae bacterium]|tara:strand:+ start:62 stop:418 length:357 start_codon:yes stop_codon:yes gene_type:complete